MKKTKRFMWLAGAVLLGVLLVAAPANAGDNKWPGAK